MIDPGLAHLLGRAGLVEERIRALVEHRRRDDPAPDDPFRGLYLTDEQRTVAEDTIADVDASGIWPGKVVTEVTLAGPFWDAEPEHQDYLERYPDGYTCHFVKPNWKLPRRADVRDA